MTPSEFFVGLDGLPTLRDRLPTRVIASLLFSLVVVLMLLAWMLSLSRGLERADAATKEIGNLRMMANQIAIALIRPDVDQHAALDQALHVQDQALALLAGGSPSRPLRLPNVAHIREQLSTIAQLWNQHLKPAVAEAEKNGETSAYLDHLPAFMAETDRLAGMIELDNDKKRTLLRFFQGVIAVIGSVGTGLAIYLLYVWIIQPMLRLREGLHRLTAGQFNTRLPVKTRDEFGVLAHGFNLMADKLERLYLELENGVRTKTAELEKRNREIASLYLVTSFLNLPNDIEAMCRGFLQRVIGEFDAAGGTVRLIELPNEHAHVIVSEDVAPQVDEQTSGTICAHADSVVYRTDDCSVATFRIMARDENLGEFALHFDAGRELLPSETQLLETLGQHLGVALDHRRLEAKARQLAVIRERSLMAQGLHDSIAQGLNFLKMQLQLLEDAMRRADYEDLQQIVPLLRTGVDESYQDVRELLVNFRTKLDQVELSVAIEDTIERFKRQTGIVIDLDTQYKMGRPLSPEQQLQVLFILQEALSNVRKHAQADHVRVTLRNASDFEMNIVDNGIGFRMDDIRQGDENHIGLNIMRERAARLHAELEMTSQPGTGTTVRLVLPHSERSVV